MSLAIDVDNVTEVLLADGWHTVKDRSFAIDAYEYLWNTGTSPHRDAEVMLGGGNEPLIPARGFAFMDDAGHWLYGPLTSVLAVKVDRS